MSGSKLRRRWRCGSASKRFAINCRWWITSLIADAESNDLPGEYCCSTLSQFLVRVLQLSHGEAASRVRAAAAVGPRSTMLGEKLEPVLPRLAALQRNGSSRWRRWRLWNGPCTNCPDPT